MSDDDESQGSQSKDGQIQDPQSDDDHIQDPQPNDSGVKQVRQFDIVVDSEPPESSEPSDASERGSPSPKPIVFPYQGYDITNFGIEPVPDELRSARCSMLFIEIKGSRYPDPSDFDNHSFFKVDFATPLGWYAGAELRMAAEDSGPDETRTSGCLSLRPRTYPEISFNTHRGFMFRLRGSVTLEDILKAIVDNNLEWFDFNIVKWDYVGFRDFITQVFYQLEARGYVDHWVNGILPDDCFPLPCEELTAYNVMAFRYNCEGKSIPSKVGMGRFPYYERVITEDMTYDTTPKDEGSVDT